MRVLITGATGFVGQHLLTAIPENWDCFVLARRPELLPSDVQAISADISGVKWTHELPDRMDVVIHLAQSLNYHTFPDAALDVFNVNVNSTAQLLNYASRSGVKQFCLFSTGSVYEPFDLTPLTESTRVQPSTINATTKLAAENISRSYESLFSVSILRVFSPYGPGQTNRLIPILIDRIKAGNPVDLAGREGVRICPLYVEDLTKITIAAIENNWQGTFNVAGNKSLSVKEISELIASKLNCGVSYSHNDKQATHLTPSLKNLGELFDLERMTDFKTGLDLTLK